MMKHTSVNLSVEHLQAIAKTGKSPSEVIRAALDAYFNPPQNAAKLIREHEWLYHLPDIAHEERIDMRETEHETRIDVSDMPEIAHELRTEEDEMRNLEHEERTHVPEPAHEERRDMCKIEHKARIKELIPENMPENAHDLSMKALTYILRELEAGKEPTVNDVAVELRVSTQAIAKALSPLGVRAQETKRGGIAGRYYTKPMKSHIEEILAKV
jgi:hypothetical protein